jgi:hypothetical protein
MESPKISSSVDAQESTLVRPPISSNASRRLSFQTTVCQGSMIIIDLTIIEKIYSCMIFFSTTIYFRNIVFASISC